MGEKVEKRQILSNGEVVFKQIPASLWGKHVGMKLVSPNWQTQNDSIEIGSEAKTVLIRPNNRLAIVAGSVRNNQGTQGIPRASVTIDDTTIVTDGHGNFTIELLYHRLRKRYRLTIWKRGFDKITDEYIPDSSKPEFRLNER